MELVRKRRLQHACQKCMQKHQYASTSEIRSSCFYQISMNIEHIIPTKSTNRMSFVFGIASF